MDVIRALGVEDPDLTRDQRFQIGVAYGIASTAHARQLDKGGRPYIEHAVAVARMVPVVCRPAALTHDVVEDCPDWDLVRLGNHGLNATNVRAVDLLTHRKKLMTYRDYIRRLKDAGGEEGVIARTVKVADLRHNSDPSRRVPGLRANPRYEWALGVLT